MNTPRKNSRSRGERDHDDRRAERGRSAPRGERGDHDTSARGPRGGARGASGSTGRDGNRGAARGSSGDRFARGGRAERSDRAGGGARGERPARSGGPGGYGRSARDDRPGRGDSPARGGRPARDDRGARGEGRDRDRRDHREYRDQRERADRSDRSSRDDRFERTDRGGRGRPGERAGSARGADSRARRGADRADRTARTDRSERSERPARSSSRVYTRRDDHKFRATGRGPAARDFRDSRVPRGGGQAERDLSPAARARLNTLRAEYDPRDDDRADDDRDTYTDVPGGIRLQKALAQAGVASRRASEELIVAGRVTVDGHTVRRFGARVDPEASEIRVDGMRVVTAPDKLYFALHKPRGVVSTMWDPEGRPTLADYTGQTEERLFHVGRLDTETEGLILLTNDGELANRLTHPRYRVVKTYIAKVPGPVPREVVREVRGGVELEDGPVEVDSFRVVENGEPQALVEVRLHEGRKHIVRRLLDAVGHPVSDLARTQIGPVGINTLKPGTMRALTANEVSELYTAAGM
ncbi:pseudouridine synthase [Streptomonospora nanhaiensis]|uniref:Pseudouridine synthase n=3 Tax=Streptomonospora nanhaiensis TaxID=1323731 RepID=A0A853BH90_9ACTN|nr:pseudouridine synthase [Streptomonospora nanhaiensis]MBV2365244.1 pseudouridine synthase [Streptomonospora nanhaiensis]NYI94749.1 pseudouridine synthase [Streptomonospora nanhaiensis]